MTGERALDVLREIIPTLVVVDIILPDVPGQQIVRYIQADDRLGKTKIIVITTHLGYISELDRQLADRVLVKPIQTVQLLQAARELLGA